MALVLRPGQPSDAAGIASVHVRSWQVAYRGIVPQQQLDQMSIEERTERWESIFEMDESGEVPVISDKIVAEADGEVVGFACFGPDRDRLDEHERGEVWSIYVDPDSWGTGAGYALLLEAMAGLREQRCTRASLWVLEANERARAFYERQGWRPDGTLQEIDVFGEQVPEVRYEINLLR